MDIVSLSGLIYPAYTLTYPTKPLKPIDKVNFDYNWGRKSHLLKRATLVKDSDDDGLQATDFVSTENYRSFGSDSYFSILSPEKCLEHGGVNDSFVTSQSKTLS